MFRWATIYWTLAGLGGLWAIFVSTLLNPTLQRNILYLHRVHSAWWHDLNRPEWWGYAEGQVNSFWLSTPDEQSLYAWHILPTGLYAEESKNWDFQTRNASAELTKDPLHRHKTFGKLKELETRLVIYFHGNAGHLAQGWRTDTYKALASADSKRIHLLTFDYRGFGNSTGSPTETGLIVDGISVVNWAVSTAKVPISNIVLVGQSLGTAVATAVAEHFAKVHPQRAFAGLVLCSGFSDIPTLMKTYAIAGFVPILSPMRSYPRLEKYFADRIVDTWNTAQRLRNLAALQPRTPISILHARNDYEIGWRHADTLFNAAVTGLKSQVRECQARDKHSEFQESAMSTEPVLYNSTEVVSRRVAREHCVDKAKGQKYLLPGERLSRTISRYGGHDHILGSNYAAVLVKDLFDAAEQEGEGDPNYRPMDALLDEI